MKELDFDELDKAVNSLMSNVPKDTTSPAVDPPTRTVELPDTANADATQSPPPVEVSNMSTESPTPLVTPRPAPSMPAARRGGRFMDVVHPSSDMKTSSTTPRISREAAQLSPVSQDTPSAPVKQQDDTPAAAPDIEPVIAPKANIASVDSENETLDESSSWPDPIDTPAFTASPVNEDTSSPEPLTSPFISGTKVEKRPLGGAQPEKDAVATQDVEPETQPTVDETAQLPPSLPDAKPDLPDELNSDVLAVESTSHQDEPAATVVPPVLSSQPPSSNSVVASSAAAGAASIPQQYTESPSTGDQTNGAVFDTNTYHKPIEHPAKKKSGWLLVVWIVLILLIGAAGGAAIYMLKIF